MIINLIEIENPVTYQDLQIRDITKVYKDMFDRLQEQYNENIIKIKNLSAKNGNNKVNIALIALSIPLFSKAAVLATPGTSGTAPVVADPIQSPYWQVQITPIPFEGGEVIVPEPPIVIPEPEVIPVVTGNGGTAFMAGLFRFNYNFSATGLRVYNGQVIFMLTKSAPAYLELTKGDETIQIMSDNEYTVHYFQLPANIAGWQAQAFAHQGFNLVQTEKINL